MSIFTTYLNDAIKSKSPKIGSKQMDLVWIVQKAYSFGMFDYTWKKFESYNTSDRKETKQFNIRLFATNEAKENSVNIVTGTDSLSWENKRPNILTDLDAFFNKNSDNSDVLIFMCGPTALAKDCEKLALKFGAAFVAESFEF